FILCRLARQEVKVVLTGDAGDENFAGYDRYVANQLAASPGGAAKLLGSRAARAVLQAIPHGDGQRDLRWRLKRFADQVGQSPAERNAGWLSKFGAAEKPQLYAAGFLAMVGAVDSRWLVVFQSSGA